MKNKLIFVIFAIVAVVLIIFGISILSFDGKNDLKNEGKGNDSVKDDAITIDGTKTVLIDGQLGVPISYCYRVDIENKDYKFYDVYLLFGKDSGIEYVEKVSASIYVNKEVYKNVKENKIENVERFFDDLSSTVSVKRGREEFNKENKEEIKLKTLKQFKKDLKDSGYSCN